MNFANPLGLLALLAVPAVLALHLFRRRLKRREVAGLFLWTATSPRADAGRRRTRLQRSASLGLELLAAVLFALWLAGPRFGVGGDVPHLVLVVDDSASMSALGIGARPAHLSARTFAGRLADALPSDGVVTVIRTGSRPEVMCGPRAPATEVARVLSDWVPAARGHDLLPALDLAVEVGGPAADIVLLTDHDLRDVPLGVRVEAFGAAGPNAAILAARRTSRTVEGVRDTSVETVFCDLTGFGGATRGRIVVVDGAGAVLAESRFELDEVREHHATLDVPATAEVVHVRVESEGDGLAIDDSCALPPPRDRIVAFAVDGDPELSARVDLPRVAAALRGVAVVADPAAAHVRIVATPGPLEPGHHEVVIRPVGERRDAWIGPFLIERRSSLVDGVTLDGVVWSAGRSATPGDPLALADALPLMTAETAFGDALRLHLNLDLGRSNLTASPDWPILIANVAEFARARLPGLADEVVPVGGNIRYRADTAAVDLVGADGSRRTARGRGVATWTADRPGLFEIERAGIVDAQVAVHFVDVGESDLDARASFTRAAERDPARRPEVAANDAPGRSEARILAFALLAALLADWWVLRQTGGGA